MALVIRRKRVWGIGKENRGTEESLHAAGDITGRVLSQCPVLKALNIPTKAACASQRLRVGEGHNCSGSATSAGGQKQHDRTWQQQNPHCFSRAAFLLFFRACIVTCLNTDRIPNYSMHGGEMESVGAFPLFFPFVFPYFSSSVTLLRWN